MMAPFIHYLTLCALATWSLGQSFGGKPQQIIQGDGGLAGQNNVTWDKHSLFVRGRRILFYSGEVHPFRIPVPSLWFDIFQKIKSMGYTGVSFYVDWALLEGKPGEIHAKGVFALEPFFEAATKAGIYLLARPGPYINAEVSGGGFPGWLQRSKGHLRTAEVEYMDRTALYVQTIGAIIAKAQITNGGPIVLFQPENEYTHGTKGFQLDPAYFNAVMDQYRRAGIVVPMISNDASAAGNNAPGSDAPVDIYGHDGYPLGFDCSSPGTWPAKALPTNWQEVHQKQSPNTPYTIPEFQGGAFDPWGGPGFEKCTSLVNSEFERVFWKNIYSFGATVFNVYMTYGGTNWGNIGHPGGYSSYDYGSVITEDRLVSREKYSEAKLQANFLVSSPSYLTAIAHSPQAGGFVGTNALTVTHLQSNRTNFLVIRHTDYASLESTSYNLLIGGTTIGGITIPQAGGNLTLNGRDSKMIVVDYDMFGVNLLYSTAEIFTVQSYENRVVLVLYGGPNEQNEMAVALTAGKALPKFVAGTGIAAATVKGHTVLSWKSSPEDRALKLGPLTIWMLDRHSAYNWWVLGVSKLGSTNAPYTREADLSVIIKGGYLMRTAAIQGSVLKLTGDINATTSIQIIAGAPKPLTGLVFNGENLQFAQNDEGVVSATIPYKQVEITVPDLSTLTWHSIDSLPEIRTGYKDESWLNADYASTDNTARNITTPTSLYASEYGYHTGTIVYRGRFRANGNEKTIFLRAQGGSAFGFSVWLNNRFIGSYVGTAKTSEGGRTFDLPKLAPNGSYVFTVVMDHMGLDENWNIGVDEMKSPRGILDYELDAHLPSDVKWKISGNFGGENYMDKARGPLNEGGMWGERQGFHLPNPPIDGDSRWKAEKPMEGLKTAGIQWYVTSFDLDVPQGYDVPIAIQLPPVVGSKATAASPPTRRSSILAAEPPVGAYRVQIFINGWQFGKYIHHIGPQTRFPVPEGIWDYHGKNWVAISLWAMEEGGAKLDDLKLVAGPVIQSGYGEVEKVDAPAWSARAGVY